MLLDKEKLTDGQALMFEIVQTELYCENKFSGLQSPEMEFAAELSAIHYGYEQIEETYNATEQKKLKEFAKKIRNNMER